MAWAKRLAKGVVGASLAGAGAYGGCNLVAHEIERRKLPMNEMPVWPATDGDGEKARRAVVVGAGAVGVSCAHRLRARGFDVVVVDAAPGPAMECSAAAAGGMQKSNPLVDRNTWSSVAKSMLPTSDAFKFFHINWGVLTDPHFMRWISAFSYNSFWSPDEQLTRQREMLKFTSWAVDALAGFLAEHNLAEACGYSKSGAVQLMYSTAQASKHTAKTISSMEPTVSLTEVELLEHEPVLKQRTRQAVGAVHETESAMANSEVFTKQLAERCEADGVRLFYGTRIRGVDVSGGRVTRLLSDKGVIPIDADTEVVVAAGSWTPRLLWHTGLFAPVYGLKGYCVALDLPKGTTDSLLPTGIVSDKYMFASRLGNQVRLASMGEFSGWDTAPTPHVDELFRAEAKEMLPHLSQMIDGRPTRCGLRPFCADGILLLGRLDQLRNVSVNVGPGFNGWKLCIGAAEVLARELAGDGSAEAEGLPFDASALKPAERVKRAPIWSTLSMARHGV